MAAAWDQLAPAEQATVRDKAVRRQVSDVLAPFSDYHRGRLAAVGLSGGSVRGARDLERVPAVGERDVCPDGDPAGAARLVVRGGEESYAAYADGARLPATLLARVVRPDAYRRLVEADTRPTVFVTSGLAVRFPLASTRADLDVLARAGARLWQVLGLTRGDAVVSALPHQPSAETLALELAALGAGSPLLRAGPDPVDVGAALRLLDATVLVVPAEAGGALLEQLNTLRVDLRGLQTVVLLGAPYPEERANADAALAAARARAAVVLAVHLPSGGRVLWGECRPGVRRAAPTGLHTYPDLDVVQTVDPETGEPVESGGELVLTQLGLRGSVLLRWRTGDLVAGIINDEPCPACGRTVPRVDPRLARAAVVQPLRTEAGTVSVDLRAVCAALDGRPELRDWRVVVGTGDRPGAGRLIVHVVPAGDPGRAVRAVAADVETLAGVAATQVVLARGGELPVAGRGGMTPVTRRVLLRVGSATSGSGRAGQDRGTTADRDASRGRD